MSKTVRGILIALLCVVVVGCVVYVGYLTSWFGLVKDNTPPTPDNPQIEQPLPDGTKEPDNTETPGNPETPPSGTETPDNPETPPSGTETPDNPETPGETEEPTVPVATNLAMELNADGQSYSVMGIGSETLTEFAIPSTYNDLPVTAIGERAFRDCYSLTSIDIPDSVTEIGGSAFSYCIALTSINLPSITSLNFEVFSGCTSLTSIEIPASVTEIGGYAFSCCTSLTSVTIYSITPPNVFYYSFYDNTVFDASDNLTAIYVPAESVEAYKADAGWSEHADIIQAIGGETPSQPEEPDTPETPDEPTVPVATNLVMGLNADGQSYSVMGIDPETATEIVIPSTYNDLPVTKIIDEAFEHTSLTSITIPSSVTSIGTYAFSGCSSLTSIEIPGSVTSIGELAFWNCTSLEVVQISYGVTSISYAMFWYCKSLTSINIPESVTYIEDSAFRQCSSLIRIYVDSVIPPALGKKVFDASDNLTAIYVPAESVEAYKAAEGWSDYANIIQAIGGETPSQPDEPNTPETPVSDMIYTLNNDGATYTLSKVNTSVSGTVEIANTCNGKPITNVAAEAFDNCAYISAIIISANITNFESYEFLGCDNLGEFIVDDNNPVYSSLSGLLYNKDKTTLIKCPNAINEVVLGSTRIGASAFRNTRLMEITVSTATEADNGAFDGAKNLERVIVSGTSATNSMTAVCNANGIAVILQHFIRAAKSGPAPTENYNIALNCQSTAYVGDEVFFTVSLVTGWTNLDIVDIRVRDNNGAEITLYSTNGSYSFIMPDRDVTVVVTVEEGLFSEW